jgi:hypothetical protein
MTDTNLRAIFTAFAEVCSRAIWADPEWRADEYQLHPISAKDPDSGVLDARVEVMPRSGQGEVHTIRVTVRALDGDAAEVTVGKHSTGRVSLVGGALVADQPDKIKQVADEARGIAVAWATRTR